MTSEFVCGVYLFCLFWIVLSFSEGPEEEYHFYAFSMNNKVLLNLN